MATVARTARVVPARKPKTPPQGLVKAIVAVTGVADEVDDVIAPGILAASLAKRWPKAVFHHDFKDFVGKVVHMEEWLPGDKRLPAKQPNGKPWPAEAGAWVADIQFNLDTERGRDSYSWAKFYAASGECAWSIGYQVPAGMAAKRAGVRHIYGIDLFEVSIVLHGAHPMTMALEVKSAAAVVAAARDGFEYKTAPSLAIPDDVAVPALGGAHRVQDDVDEPPTPPRIETKSDAEHADDVMVALYPHSDVANALAVPGGEDPNELHVTLAYLGKHNGEYGPQEVVDAVRKAVAGRTALSGQIGGLGIFPAEGSGTPVWAPVDVPGLEKLREAVVDELDAHPTLAGRVARNHGYTPHMTLGFDLPTVSPAPTTPVSFGDVVVVHGTDRYPVPIGGMDSDPDVGVFETKAAHDVVAQARRLTRMETKMIRIPGSHEERRELLDAALNEKYGERKADGLACAWVYPEATFDDRVVVTIHKDHGGARTLEVPYTWEGGKVKLGEGTEVTVGYTPAAGAPAEVPAPVDRAVAPVLTSLTAAAAALGALPLETKALRALYPTVVSMLDALAGKGMDVVAAALGEDPLDDPDAPVDDVAPVDDTDVDTAPGDDEDTYDPYEPDDGLDDTVDVEPDDEPEGEPEDDEDRVSLDPDEVRAELDSLTA